MINVQMFIAAVVVVFGAWMMAPITAYLLARAITIGVLRAQLEFSQRKGQNGNESGSKEN